MPRPKLPRHIISSPIAREFRPEGGEHADEKVVLSLEEFEAVRLIDFEGLDQSGAAAIMKVSRQTVGRILKAGRFKLAKSVVQALRLKVTGGCYKIYKNGPGPRSHGRGRGRRPGGRGMGHGRHQSDRSEEFQPNDRQEEDEL